MLNLTVSLHCTSYCNFMLREKIVGSAWSVFHISYIASCRNSDRRTAFWHSLIVLKRSADCLMSGYRCFCMVIYQVQRAIYAVSVLCKWIIYLFGIILSGNPVEGGGCTVLLKFLMYPENCQRETAGLFC